MCGLLGAGLRKIELGERRPSRQMAERLLRDPQCCLVTLIGPGGIGKTRLAVEVAFAQRERFAVGVHFIPLASVSAPVFIVPAIAAAIRFAFLWFVGPACATLELSARKGSVAGAGQL